MKTVCKVILILLHTNTRWLFLESIIHQD